MVGVWGKDNKNTRYEFFLRKNSLDLRALSKINKMMYDLPKGKNRLKIVLIYRLPSFMVSA